MRIYLIALVCLLNISVYADNDAFQSKLKELLFLVENPAQGADYTKLAEEFVLLSQQHDKEWSALYYTSYVHYLSALGSRTPEERDSKMSKALAYATEAGKLFPQHAEIMTLQAYIMVSHVQVTNTTLSPEKATEIQQLLTNARSIDPSNPRAAYTAALLKLKMGKNTEAAELAKESVTLFEKETNPTLPHAWGKFQAIGLAGKLGK